MPIMISIIIPTHNHLDDFLRPCLESIQKYTDSDRYEVIVVSNGSTDGTDDYVRSLESNFHLVTTKNALGFTTATNLGVYASRGNLLVFLNNDTVLLPQEKNRWIELLSSPFILDETCGVSGPVKFTWDCGSKKKTCIAFWCAMTTRKLFDEIGGLDEAFSPGMGEDGEYCIQTELLGYKLVQTPESDGVRHYGEGAEGTFPIYHFGSGTFASVVSWDEITQRNKNLLQERYNNPHEDAYDWCMTHISDVHEHNPILRRYARKCKHVTEMGYRNGNTVYALIAAKPKNVVSYDIEYSVCSDITRVTAQSAGVDWVYKIEDTLTADIEETDLLFIDTKHTYTQLLTELWRHAQHTRKYIILHDTETYGEVGEGDDKGLMYAVREFLAGSSEWVVVRRYTNNNGLLIMKRVK